MKPVNVLFDKKLNKYQNPYPFPNGKKIGRVLREGRGRWNGFFKQKEWAWLDRNIKIKFISIEMKPNKSWCSTETYFAVSWLAYKWKLTSMLINLQIKERQQKQESVHKNPIFPETEANNP